MAKVFIGGSRNWDMFPDEVVVDIDEKILSDIIKTAYEHGDEIVVGDCPEGVDRWVLNAAYRIGDYIAYHSIEDEYNYEFDRVKLVIVTQGLFPRTVDTINKIKNNTIGVDIDVVSLQDLYEKGDLAEFLEARDIFQPDCENQRLKDEWMLENTDIHRFIWNGKSRATYRNALISGYTTESNNTIIYRPYVVADRVVWTAKFTYGDDFHDDCMSDI